MKDELLFRALTARCTDSERRTVEAWRNASPVNELRYTELARLLKLCSLADRTWESCAIPPAAEIVAAADACSRVTAPRLRFHLPGPLWQRGIAAAAAGFLLLIVGFSVLTRWPPQAQIRTQEVVTGPTESATVNFSDGTVVRLGPESRLRTFMGELGETFLEGQAYFAVAKQERQTTRIRTSAGTARVLGTRFKLDARGADLELVVVEGTVVLESGGTETEVGALEIARIRSGSSLPQVETLPSIDLQDSNLMPAWLEGFVAFQRTPLDAVARELERQYEVHIEIVDDGLAATTFTGWFFGWPVDEVLEVVCAATNADCSTDTDDSVIMRLR